MEGKEFHFVRRRNFQNGIELFNGEIKLSAVTDNGGHIELTWDEQREEWFEVIVKALRDDDLFLRGS